MRETAQAAAPAVGSRSGWILAAGFLGLAIAIASIADMFSARPYDGIVPVPYGREGIEVRETVPGSPAEKAGIKAGECILGIGKRIVKSSSDASAELRRHKIGEKVSYLVRSGPCPTQPRAEPAGELRDVRLQLSSERLGGRTYLYAVVVGFLFYLIGLFVFVRVPQERSARIFFILCVLFLIFFVCRLRPASYWWIDIFVQNTGTVSLFLLPAVFLHFFLVFPRPKRLHFAKPDEWTGEPPARWKAWLQNFLSASPELLYLLYAVPPFVFLYDVFRQVQGDRVTILSGAPCPPGSFSATTWCSASPPSRTRPSRWRSRARGGRPSTSSSGRSSGRSRSSSSSSFCRRPSGSTSTPSTGSSP